MKKLIIFFVLCIFSISLYAQTGDVEKKYTILESQLTAEQLTKVREKEVEKKLEQYGKWVGVGEEVGIAVREGLLAVVDVADKAGDTNVGKFTMYLIAWKVIGKDFVRIILGIIIGIFMTVYIFRSSRKLFSSHKVLIENPGFLKYPKKYEVIKPIEDEEMWHAAIWYKVLYFAILLGSYGIVYAIMFS